MRLGSTYHRTTCRARDISAGNDQGTTEPSPDWAYAYFKGECDPGQFVKGVSHDSTTGKMRKLLCCDKAL